MARMQGASRPGAQGAAVVSGVDAIVAEFLREADTVRPRAASVVVQVAKDAADIMRDLVPVDQGDVQESITSDPAAVTSGTGVYAEAGPDKVANKQAFVARYLEYGTSKMSPRPFVHPAADRVLSKFEKAIRDLSKL